MAESNSTRRGHNFKDLTGRRFGKWTVIAFHSATKVVFWLCRCDCGRERVVQAGNLLGGKSTQCKPCARTKHGMSDTPEHISWTNMLQRCQNPMVPEYSNYGGREGQAITVCERWKSFENFYEDMGPKPFSKATIERTNNSLSYSKENCKWATMKEQARNTRRNRILTLNGQSMCLAEWAEKVGIPYNTLVNRLNRGWDVERALTMRPKARNRS